MGHTFELTEVDPDDQPLGTTTLAQELTARGLRDVLVADCSEPALAEALSLNSFVMAMHVAYTRHRPLTVSPDAVWLCIAQGLARHIDEHAGQLRGRLVRHTGKLTLETLKPELALEPHSVTHWSAAVEDLAGMVRTHLGGRADLFVARFSTTDACSRVASQITLLGAVQAYFEYVVNSLCGIPRVTLTGTVDDWRDLRARAHILDELDLGWWRKELDPVLAALEDTARGKPSRRFWERAYKVHHGSGGESISGWVNALFPYLGERGDERNPWFEVGDGASELELPKLRSYPSGLASAPFTWKLLGGDRAMRLVAGFVGVARRGEGVAPAIGWAVTPAAPDRRFRAIDNGNGVTVSPRDAAALTSLEGLGDELAADGHTRATLSLWWCHQLTSLAGVAEAPMIKELTILSCDNLADLSPLVAATSLEYLMVQQCPRVADLTPLARMPHLRHLGVNHCPEARDLRPIAALTQLEVLDLFGDTIPQPLRGRHTGRDAIAAVLAKIGD